MFLTNSAVTWSKRRLRLFLLEQESWYEFRVMAVMDDLISESSNVVGVSSTGQFLLTSKVKKKKKNLGLSLSLNSPLDFPHQIPSPLRSYLKRGWRGLWWRVLWQPSVFWQQPYCSALSLLALSISNTVANSSASQVSLPIHPVYME